uniref:F-box and leucine rich repeat protein 12 n=1 Tax=Canis lupus familiaris TaxID=9615 RepID=A0A8I3PHB6_CANLF
LVLDPNTPRVSRHLPRLAPGPLVTAPAAPSRFGPSPSPAPSLVTAPGPASGTPRASASPAPCLVTAPGPASGPRRSFSHAFRARAWFPAPSSALRPGRGGSVAGTGPCSRRRKAESPSAAGGGGHRSAGTPALRRPLASPGRDPEAPQPPAEVGVGRIMATLADLPDSVLLEIFSYLPVRDRIRISRVCHRWKRLVDDRWLWRHVDLTLYTTQSFNLKPKRPLQSRKKQKQNKTKNQTTVRTMVRLMRIHSWFSAVEV